MRVSDSMNFEQVRHNLSQNRTKMSDLQNQAATQKRVTKPSDDPVAASRVLSSRIELQGNEQYTKNLGYAKSFLQFTDQSLEELTEHLVRLKELTLSQAGDSGASEETRRIVATEVAQIYDQIVKIGNRKLGDRFIFGGYKTTAAPFEYSGRYMGDAGEIMIPVDKGSFVAMNLPGAKVFSGEGLSADGVAHVTTQQAQDIETLEQQSERAEEPVRSVQPPPATEMRGPASLRTPQIDPQPQIEPASENGTNLFSVVKKLEIALNANDKLAVQDSLDRLDSAISQVVLARSQVGSRVTVLDSALGTLQKEKVETHGTISQLEDADIFEVVSDINKTENTLQATLQTSGKLMPPSLLDFLR